MSCSKLRQWKDGGNLFERTPSEPEMSDLINSLKVSSEKLPLADFGAQFKRSSDYY
jgi:hypothetical protein